MTDGNGASAGLARPQPRYRLLVLGENGIVLRTEHLSAASDDAAMALAQAMALQNAVELWDGLRFIEQFSLVADGL